MCLNVHYIYIYVRVCVNTFLVSNIEEKLTPTYQNLLKYSFRTTKKKFVPHDGNLIRKVTCHRILISVSYPS